MDSVSYQRAFDKEQLAILCANYDRRIDSLGAENAKLRELVRTLYHCTTSGECDECPINGGGPVHLMPDTICDTIHERMREAGVEV